MRGETSKVQCTPDQRPHFNPLAPCGARQQDNLKPAKPDAISIHSPRTGRDTVSARFDDHNLTISIHSPRAGRDLSLGLVPRRPSVFQSTRPVRGETAVQKIQNTLIINFNPLAPCGARHLDGDAASKAPTISIHSPRAGRDLEDTQKALAHSMISIHSPRAGRDVSRFAIKRWRQKISIHSPRAGRDTLSSPFSSTVNLIFQSTRPVRGETRVVRVSRLREKHFNPLAPCGARRYTARRGYVSGYFNPLAPCGARRLVSSCNAGHCAISIHSPRAGRDSHILRRKRMSSKFQSTRPVRGETGTYRVYEQMKIISIHSPRAGRDSKSVQVISL